MLETAERLAARFLSALLKITSVGRGAEGLGGGEMFCFARGTKFSTGSLGALEA